VARKLIWVGSSQQEHIDTVKRRLKIAAEWDAETIAREKKRKDHHDE